MVIEMYRGTDRPSRPGRKSDRWLPSPAHSENPKGEGFLREKTAMVAGATGAIGHATCLELLEQGASVIGLGKDQARLDDLMQELSRFEHRFTPIRLAGLSEGCWNDAAQRVVAAHGPIDLFVHAIGVLNPGAVLELDESQIETIIRTNLLSVIWSARAIARHMAARGRGQIVVVGSLGGLIPMPYQAIYCATKFAVRGFCLALHEELHSRGVFVSLISPGPVRSPMLAVEAVDPRAAMVLAPRPAEPCDVAAHVVRVIRRPRRELVMPASSLQRVAAGIVNAYPELFGILFPHLQRLGQRRLRWLPDGTGSGR